jgi:hypothetical protein
MTSSITPSRAWPSLALLLLLPQLSLAAPAAPPLPTLTVRLLPGTDPSVLESLVNVRSVKGPGQPMLQLDLAHKRILNAAGQIVVESDGHNPIHLQGTMDKWRYVQSLGALAASHPQAMHIDSGSHPLRAPPSPPAFYNGEPVSFVVTDLTPGRQLTVFNLSPIGTLQLLYPYEDQPDAEPRETVLVPAQVSSPFGVDHVIAVSATDPAGMHALVAWLAETAQADGMLDTKGAFLEQVMALRNVRVGMVSTFSCLSASNCKR